MSHFSSLKQANSIIDIFMENPKKYMASLTLAEEFLREPSALSSKDREIIASYTSHLNKCKYCFGSHKIFSLSLGATEDEITSIISENYQEHRLAKVLDYVKKLTLLPSSLTEEDFSAVLVSGVSEEELKDAIAVCAAFNYFNRIVEGHFLSENLETWNTASEMITTHGYDRRR